MIRSAAATPSCAAVVTPSSHQSARDNRRTIAPVTASRADIGLWFALEDARLDNGCLWAIPGAHRGGLRSRFVRTGRTTHFDTLDDRPWDDVGLVPLEVAKGDLIVLDGLCPHMSQANRSPTSRHAYTLHVVSGRSAYPPSNWLQRATPARGFTD